MAHLGYLLLTKASIRCCISFWKSSSLVQTVLALWVSVLMTLYITAKLWWLFHCKYWSVWVGFWYPGMDRELSASGVTKVSRKGMDPFSWLPSTVNFIAGSMLLMWSRNDCLWASCWMTKVSSTNLNQYLGGWRQTGELLSSKMFHIQVGHYRAYQRPHSAPSTCS